MQAEKIATEESPELKVGPMLELVACFGHKRHETKESLQKEYKESAEILAQSIWKEMSLTATPNANHPPPIACVMSLRMFFAFIGTDQMIDFHLNWLEWCSHDAGGMPTIISMSRDMDDIIKKVRQIKEHPEKWVSVAKVTKMRKCLNQQYEKIMEMKKHSKMYALYVMYISFVQLTMSHNEHLKELQNGVLHSHKETCDMKKTLATSQKHADTGLKEKVGFRAKKFERS